MLETHKVKWTDPAPQAVLLPPQVPLVTQMPPSPKHTLQTINKNEIKRTQKYSNITLNNRKLRGWNWLELQIAKTSHWLKQNKKPSGSAEIPRLDSTNAGVCSTVEGEGRKKWLSYTFWSAQKSWESDSWFSEGKNKISPVRRERRGWVGGFGQVTVVK